MKTILSHLFIISTCVLYTVHSKSHDIRIHDSYDSLATFQQYNNQHNPINFSITPPFRYQGVPPTWKQSWNIADSTAIYACNYSGPFDLSYITKFAFISIDW